MANNNGNRGNRQNGNQQRNTAPQTPGQPPAEDTVVQANGEGDTPETPEDGSDAAVAAMEAQLAAAGDAPEAETSVDDAPVDESTDDVPTDTASDSTAPSEDDEEAVTQLKTMLAEFVTANSVKSTNPDDYAPAAKIAAQITKHVIKYPRNSVQKALLDFFVEHKDGAASVDFMKGSTTLDRSMEQKVGFLYNLFITLANKQVAKIEPSRIINVLGKAEFVTFYQRRQAAIIQNG